MTFQPSTMILGLCLSIGATLIGYGVLPRLGVTGDVIPNIVSSSGVGLSIYVLLWYEKRLAVRRTQKIVETYEDAHR